MVACSEAHLGGQFSSRPLYEASLAHEADFKAVDPISYFHSGTAPCNNFFAHSSPPALPYPTGCVLASLNSTLHNGQLKWTHHQVSCYKGLQWVISVSFRQKTATVTRLSCVQLYDCSSSILPWTAYYADYSIFYYLPLRNLLSAHSYHLCK